MSEEICFYHRDSDGIMAAAIISTKYPNAEFVDVDYGEDIDTKRVDGKTVIMVDFTVDNSRKFRNMIRRAKRFIWIDHHKTAKEKYPDLWCMNNKIKGMRHTNACGAFLTWQYFIPYLIPRAVYLVDDYDRWVLKSADSKPFNEALSALGRNPDAIPKIRKLLTDKRLVLKYIKRGNILLEAKLTKAKGMIENGFKAKFEGHKAFMVNTASYINEVGELILNKGYDIAICYFDKGDKRIFSLRSRDNIDVGELAKKHGGGGHKNAAGFHIERPEIRFNETKQIKRKQNEI